MARWRSRWTTPYPSAREKLDRIIAVIDTYELALKSTLDSIEKEIEQTKNPSALYTLGIMKFHLSDAINTLEQWEKNIEELEKEKSPEEILELISYWVKFEKGSHNEYISKFAEDIEKIIRGE